MLALNHWYYRYPNNLRRAYYTMLVVCWVIIFFIIGMAKLSQIQAARREAAETNVATILVPAETLKYSDMAPPPSLSSDNFEAEAPLPEAAPAAVEDVTSSVPLPVPDEQADVSTMATAKSIAGVAAPAATGTGAPVFIMPETTKTYTDNNPAPATFRYMKAAVMPEPLHVVQPEYPEQARALGIEGTSVVLLWLRKDGTVSRVQISKSAGNTVLDSAAAQAAGKCTFTPAKGPDGNPVNVWVSWPFHFVLH
jgi:protein TonB